MSSEQEKDTKTTEEKKIDETEKENMCALEYDIKKKGENAYYYAHKSRF